MEKKIIIDGVETDYIITDEGIIINSKTNKELKVRSNGSVSLNIAGKHKTTTVKKLVATAFIPNPENLPYTINIDGDKTNNKIDNIKWISASENSNNTWRKRRENKTTNNGIKLNRKISKNIVGRQEITEIEPNEKRIILDGKETSYVVNPHGRIRNLKTNRTLNGSILHSYRYINFRQDGMNRNKAVHRLVAEAFIPNPENKPYVDHIDGDRLNNDISNLRWATELENAQNKHLDKTPESPKFDEIVFTQEELDNEIWKEYKDTGYFISNLGRVRGIKNKILSGTKLMSGYISYSLGRENLLGHLLVWITFIGNKKENTDINHIDGNKHNNRLSNLEEVSHQENMQKAADETNAWNFRKVGEYNDKGELLNVYLNASDAARRIGILPGSMRNTIRRNGKCFNGLMYKYL